MPCNGTNSQLLLTVPLVVTMDTLAVVEQLTGDVVIVVGHRRGNAGPLWFPGRFLAQSVEQ